MLLTEHMQVPSELMDEFNKRVRHNFKAYVLLGLRQGNWNQIEIIQMICRLKGYKCHKIIKYDTFWGHIHIKFEDEENAKESVSFLKRLDGNFIVEILENMLKAWYGFEMKTAYEPPYTYAIVDVVGTFPNCINPLTEPFTTHVLGDFGSPYVYPYKAPLEGRHVQVLFYTMAEALAAAMALGVWFVVDKPMDCFYYRVRIRPYCKETSLIMLSGGLPNEAFKLDYFILFQHELNSERRVKEIPERQTAPVSVQSKLNREHIDQAMKLNYMPAMPTPIICIPILTPFQQEYGHAILEGGQQPFLQPVYFGDKVGFRMGCDTFPEDPGMVPEGLYVIPEEQDEEMDQLECNGNCLPHKSCARQSRSNFKYVDSEGRAKATSQFKIKSAIFRSTRVHEKANKS